MMNWEPFVLVPIAPLLWLVQRRCVELADAYTHLVFAIVSVSLPALARTAWRNEVLNNDLLPRMMDDLKAGQPRVEVAFDAALRATNLLGLGWFDRGHYIRNTDEAEGGSQEGWLRRVIRRFRPKRNIVIRPDPVIVTLSGNQPSATATLTVRKLPAPPLGNGNDAANAVVRRRHYEARWGAFYAQQAAQNQNGQPPL